MDNKQRMNYAGAIGLLCECSVKLGNGAEADEMRDSIGLLGRAGLFAGF